MTTVTTTVRVRPWFDCSARFESGEDSPSAYLERCLACIGAWDHEVKAWVVLADMETLRAEAKSSTVRWRSGAPTSPIDGMPIGIKDIMETRDMPTEQGSPLFKGWTSGRDCAAVAALREAGALIVGKTVTTELASTEPRGTCNPHDLTRTPGGSSSGSGAAVGCGMVPAALGTQVIGSILRPAAYCGCVGYKPSVGGLHRGGSFDGLSQSCTGVIGAGLPECWAVARAISCRVGGDPGFPGVTGPLETVRPCLPSRVAVVRPGTWEDRGLPAILAAVSDKLRDHGIIVVDASTHALIRETEAVLADAMDLSFQILTWEGRWPLNTYHRDLDSHDSHSSSSETHRTAATDPWPAARAPWPHPTGLSPARRNQLADAEAMTQEDYAVCLARRDRARRTHARLRSEFAVCLTLTTPGKAPLLIPDNHDDNHNHNNNNNDGGKGRPWATGDPTFTVQTSLLGVPSVTLPVLEEDGMPLGLQLYGYRNEDAALFAAAGAIHALW